MIHTKIKYLLKLTALCSIAFAVCSDKSTIPWEKRKIQGTIKIPEIHYNSNYECNYWCQECYLYGNANGRHITNSNTERYSQRYQDRLRRKCEIDKTRQHQTVDWGKSYCDNNCDWDFWVWPWVKCEPVCYKRNKWGDVLETCGTYSGPGCICDWHFFLIRFILPDSASCSTGTGGIGGGGGGGGGGDGGGGGAPDGTNFNGELVEFHPAAVKYGFDSWRNIDTGNVFLSEENSQTSYVSVKDGGDSTAIQIGVNFVDGYYDRFEARIRNNGSRTASFSKTNLADTVRTLSSGKYKTLQIFGHNEGTAEIEVWGVNDETGRDVCINKQGEQVVDRLIIKVYREHIFDDFNVYTVGNVNFRPTTQNWVNGFNNILKQMVARLDLSKTLVTTSNTGWDVNGNGILDVILNMGFEENNKTQFNGRYHANREWDSEDRLLAIKNGEYNNVINNSHTQFIVPELIRMRDCPKICVNLCQGLYF